MKNLFKKGWFQVIVFGVVIGLILIVLDNKYHFLEGKKSEDDKEYRGLVGSDKDKMYITKASYSATEYNFGKVKEGDTVIHVFKIKNTGKEPLFIYKGAGSCECIRVGYSKDPIMPGGEQDITVAFMTKGRKGFQNRSAMIDTNTDPSEMVLRIIGEVE